MAANKTPDFPVIHAKLKKAHELIAEAYCAYTDMGNTVAACAVQQAGLKLSDVLAEIDMGNPHFMAAQEDVR